MTKKNKTPDYYKFEIDGKEYDVFDIIKALDKKLDKDKIKFSRFKYALWTDTIEYLIRAPFKGIYERDLEQVIICSEVLLEEENQ